MAAKATDGARKSLTEGAILKAAREAKERGQRIDLADAGCRGLVIRLTPAGAKTWVLSVRDHDGKPRRFPLDGGSFPQMSIAEARAAAMALHGKVKAGFDPISQKRERRGIAADARQGVGTLAALLETYETMVASGRTGGKTMRSWPAAKGAISHVFKKHLDKPVMTMTALDLQRTAQAHTAIYNAALAVRCLRPVLKWASKPVIGLAPPGIADLEPPAVVRRRDRSLSAEELRALLPVLKASDQPHAAALRFMLLTLSRRDETCGARWRDVDFDAGTWRIPTPKNGQPHIVPLPRQAIDLLRARLPKDDADGNPVAPAPNALVFSTATGGPLGNWDRTTNGLLLDGGLAEVREIDPARKAVREARSGKKIDKEVVMIDAKPKPTRHDLRRTGATMLGEMGVMPHVIEAALNHVSIHNRLAATYNRSRYRPEVAEALQRLADKLDTIEKGGAKVIPLEARRA